MSTQQPNGNKWKLQVPYSYRVLDSVGVQIFMVIIAKGFTGPLLPQEIMVRIRCTSLRIHLTLTPMVNATLVTAFAWLEIYHPKGLIVRD